MEMQELEITIDREGRVQVQVKGVQGPSCLSLTRDLEAAVGVVTERTCSPAYYEEPVITSEHQQTRRG